MPLNLTDIPHTMQIAWITVFAGLSILSIFAYAPFMRKVAWARATRSQIKSWWLISLLFATVLTAGKELTIIVFAFISFIAIREFLTLAPTRREDRIAVFCLYLSVLSSYWSVWIDNYAYFLVISPIFVFVAITTILSLGKRSEHFLATSGIMFWGMIICVFNVGHAAFLMHTPEAETSQAGPAGLVFFLLGATVLSDALIRIANHLVGRTKLGTKSPKAPTIEGILFGALSSAIILVVLSPYFSPLTFWHSVLVFSILPVLGAFGGVTMQAVRDDIGVRASSRLLAGQGGVLDRIANLSFTAPWFFHMHALFALERF